MKMLVLELQNKFFRKFQWKVMWNIYFSENAYSIDPEKRNKLLFLVKNFCWQNSNEWILSFDWKEYFWDIKIYERTTFKNLFLKNEIARKSESIFLWDSFRILTIKEQWEY